MEQNLNKNSNCQERLWHVSCWLWCGNKCINKQLIIDTPCSYRYTHINLRNLNLIITNRACNYNILFTWKCHQSLYLKYIIILLSIYILCVFLHLFSNFLREWGNIFNRTNAGFAAYVTSWKQEQVVLFKSNERTIANKIYNLINTKQIPTMVKYSVVVVLFGFVALANAYPGKKSFINFIPYWSADETIVFVHK